MPVDPSISLGVIGGGKGMMQVPAGGGNAISPLETASAVAGTIERLNQIKLFNAQFGARQKAGQILAQAPDIMTGIKILQSDPETSAFAPELAASAITTQNSILEAGAREQGQGFDAFSNVLKGLPAVIKDPGQWDTLKNTSLELASPAIRQRLAKSMGYLKDSLDSAPPEKRNQLLVGWATAGGFGDAARSALGVNKAVNIGGQTQFGVEAPVEGGPGGEAPGSFTPANALTNTLPPQIAGQGGVQVGGGGGAAAPTGNPLVPVAPQAKPVSAAEPAAAPSSPLAGDGKPLFPKDFKINSQTSSPGYVGGKTPQQALQSTKLMENFTTDGHKEYKNAQTALGLLDEMDENFDTMERSGGFTKPGAGADQRIQLGKVMNMVSDLFGGKPVVSPSGTAAAEDLVKGTKRMGANLTNQLFGTQREAAQTIENITKAVPGIENTYLGGKLITSLIRASVKRSMDEYEFHNQYQNKTKGDLTGADIAFSNEHPMIGFIKPVLESFGMTGEGFKNKGALKNAVLKGWLTPQQATTVAKQQGFKLGEE